MNQFSKVTLIVVTMAVSVTSVYAQEPLRDGKYTLDIRVPDNTSAAWVGGRMFLDASSAIQVDVNFLQQAKDTDTNQESATRIGIKAGYMEYISQNRVSPYWQTGASLSLYSGDGYKDADNDLRGYAGLGVEYMITKELSIRTNFNAILKLSPSFSVSSGRSDLKLSFYF